MKLDIASIDEAQEISDLLNLAYRGERGWPTENSLVDGSRSSATDVERSIERSVCLTYKLDGKVVACICLEAKDHQVYIGSFAVHPDHQLKGLGKSLLTAAENYAITQLKATKFIMVVLTQRTELIAFYERRGYLRTGEYKTYPRHLNIGIPKVDNLTIEQLYKNATLVL